MRTKGELISFLYRVVGEPYVIIDADDTGNGKVDIKPYSYEITRNHQGEENSISGIITFKGEEMEQFNYSTRHMVNTLIDCMNHAYSKSIQDCLAGDPDMLNDYKMSRFKFQ